MTRPKLLIAALCGIGIGLWLGALTVGTLVRSEFDARSSIHRGYSLFASDARAARNGSGTMSLYTPGNPVISGTIINSATFNSTMSDIASELTDSLSRSGKGAMLAQLTLISGGVGTPGLGFGLETNSGLYRNAANDIRFAIAGADAFAVATSGLRLINGVVATPSLSFLNDTGSGLYRNASNDVRFAVNGADVFKWTAGAATATGTLTSTGVFTASSTSTFTGAASFGSTISLTATPTISATAADSSLTLYGNRSAGGTGIDVILGSTATRVAGTLADVQNAGATRFKIGYAGDITVTGATSSMSWQDSTGNLSITGTGATGGRISANGLNIAGSQFAGAVALSSGSQTVTVASPHACVCTDTTANASVKCSVASTTLTITGTGSDTIAYFCF